MAGVAFLPILFATIWTDENTLENLKKKKFKPISPTCAMDNRKVDGIGVWGIKMFGR